MKAAAALAGFQLLEKQVGNVLIIAISTDCSSFWTIRGLLSCEDFHCG